MATQREQSPHRACIEGWRKSHKLAASVCAVRKGDHMGAVLVPAGGSIMKSSIENKLSWFIKTMVTKAE